jgi:hypothetical protein
MSTSESDDESETKPSPERAPALAIVAVPVQLIVLGPQGPRAYDDSGIEVGPPTLFAVAPAAPVTRRYLYLLQKETDPETGVIVLLLVADTHHAAATRVPPAGAWQCAIVTGTVHLLASNLELTRQDIVAFIGGHEPPPTPAKPPHTNA